MGRGHLPRQFREMIFCFVVDLWTSLYGYLLGHCFRCGFSIKLNEIVAYQELFCVVTLQRATQFLADLFADIARLIFSTFTGIVSKIVVSVEVIAETSISQAIPIEGLICTDCALLMLSSFFKRGSVKFGKIDNVEKQEIYLRVNVFSTKVLIGDTIFYLFY